MCQILTIYLQKMFRRDHLLKQPIQKQYLTEIG